MCKQHGPVYFTGTVDGICYYRLNGAYYARRKSTLSGKRVKRDPKFARTRQHAELLGRASRIAAEVYRLLPKDQKRLVLYMTMTGKAMALLKSGMPDVEVREQLQQRAKMPVKRPAVQAPVVRMRAKTGGMDVVKTVWGKELTVDSGQLAVSGRIWTVMTKERVYQVRLPDARCLSS